MRPLTCLLAILAPSFAAAATIHVPGDQPTIQAALNAASIGDTVEAACGTYYEHDITMRDQIVLRSESGFADCVTIDAQHLGRVIGCSGLLDATIEGLTLANGLTPTAGGGMLVQASDVTVRQCRFLQNEAHSGGGLYASGSLSLYDCDFIANSAAGTYGGGMWIHGNALISQCAFLDNEAWSGGAVVCRPGSKQFIGCVFERNTGWSDGVVTVYNPGAVATFSECVFADNVGEAALGLLGDPKVYSSVALEGCIFVNNAAPAIRASVKPGFIDLHVERCVLAFNSGGAIGGSSHVVSAIRCTDIFGNTGGDWIGSLADSVGVGGNIAVDPLFCDFLGGHYTVYANSPCLPGNHPDGVDCGLIGAFGQGCGPVSVEQETWAGIKAKYKGGH